MSNTPRSREADAIGGDVVFEDVSVGRHASGFGSVGDGRSFAFHLENRMLHVDIYRPRPSGPVPGEEDVVARSAQDLTHVDIDDERSLSAAVRDALAAARPVPRRAR